MISRITFYLTIPPPKKNLRHISIDQVVNGCHSITPLVPSLGFQDPRWCVMQVFRGVYQHILWLHGQEKKGRYWTILVTQVQTPPLVSLLWKTLLCGFLKKKKKKSVDKQLAIFPQNLMRLYLDKATLVWNGNAVSGQAALGEFFESLPSSEFSIQTLDCQPVHGEILSLNFYWDFFSYNVNMRCYTFKKHGNMF